MCAVLYHLLAKGWYCPAPIVCATTEDSAHVQQYIVIATKDQDSYNKFTERMSEEERTSEGLEWKEFWGSEPTVDQTFKAHVFRVNNTFPAVQQMIVWFLLAFTKPQDVVWQLNGTSLPFFAECAIATGRLPLVVVDNEKEEDSALTRLLAVETFVRTKPIDMEQHRQRRRGNVHWENTGSVTGSGIPPAPVALWSGYSEPERVITILGLVSCTQNATHNADVGSFAGEYASATWLVDSQTPIDKENDSQTQVDDKDAGAGSGRDDLLTKDLRIGKSSLLTSEKTSPGLGVFAVAGFVAGETCTRMEGRWIAKCLSATAGRKNYCWQIDDFDNVHFVSSSTQYFDFMNDPRDLFTPSGQKAVSNVKIVLNCDGGALDLQAQCIAKINAGDELLFSYGGLFWDKDKAAKAAAKAAEASAGKREIKTSKRKRGESESEAD